MKERKKQTNKQTKCRGTVNYNIERKREEIIEKGKTCRKKERKNERKKG